MQFKLTQDIIIGSGGIEDQNMEEPSTYHKVSINKLAEEKEKYKVELDFLKSKMSAEKISLWRKFIGDTLKYVPVIITTTIAVYKLFAIAK